MDSAEEIGGYRPWSEVTPDAARRLLVAAVDAFAERGYHATTTRDIAGRAGMSPAALYIHYKTKEELLHRISRIGHDKALEILDISASGPGGAAERLDAAVRSFVRWHAAHHTTARVVQYELDALAPEHRSEIVALRRQSEAAVRRILAEGVAAGSSRSPTFRVPRSRSCPCASTSPAGSARTAAARPTRSARSTPTSCSAWWGPVPGARRRPLRARRLRARLRSSSGTPTPPRTRASRRPRARP